MLQFLYDADYDTASEFNPLVFHVYVAIIADKYFIKPLQDCAERKFDHEFKVSTTASKFPDAVVAVYDSGNEHMKRTVVGVTKSNYQPLFLKTGSTTFKQLLLELPEYAAATAEALAEELATVDQELTAGVRISEKTLSDTTWYACPDADCRYKDAIFSVPTRLVCTRRISCPFGCTYSFERDSKWWAKHKIASPYSG